jgi:RimJ/RimL family protein N-acetyltransferase
VVGTQFQGHGIAGEAAEALVCHLEAGGVTRFTAHIADRHLASLAVARRIELARTDLVDSAGERLHVRG